MNIHFFLGASCFVFCYPSSLPIHYVMKWCLEQNGCIDTVQSSIWVSASPLPRCTTNNPSTRMKRETKWQVAETTTGGDVNVFVLTVSLAMRLVVLYTWIKEKCPQSKSDCEKSEQPMLFGGWLLASRLLEILRRSLIDPSFPVAT